uniref:C-C motif chemokine 15 n=1 Tax=Jaculus jaculus TaxID=51337 RepID=UPI001E1B3406|nr:C-C motif chemokine 15 [Jaculus jaculus]
MKVSMATLCYIILAAALGTQAASSNRLHQTHQLPGAREWLRTKSEPPSVHTAFHQPADCCNFYVSRSIVCANMKDYFRTSSGCSQPGIIFLTKKGKRICAKPSDPSVQKCISTLMPHGEYRI